MNFLPFVESFVPEVFQEDLNIIANLLMLIDFHAAFAMFSFCYAQQPSYL
jgi:DNA phosphorothioation-dependent restriction protein DptG